MHHAMEVYEAQLKLISHNQMECFIAMEQYWQMHVSIAQQS